MLKVCVASLSSRHVTYVVASSPSRRVTPRARHASPRPPRPSCNALVQWNLLGGRRLSGSVLRRLASGWLHQRPALEVPRRSDGRGHMAEGLTSVVSWARQVLRSSMMQDSNDAQRSDALAVSSSGGHACLPVHRYPEAPGGQVACCQTDRGRPGGVATLAAPSGRAGRRDAARGEIAEAAAAPSLQAASLSRHRTKIRVAAATRRRRPGPEMLPGSDHQRPTITETLLPQRSLQRLLLAMVFSK